MFKKNNYTITNTNGSCWVSKERYQPQRENNLGHIHLQPPFPPLNFCWGKPQFFYFLLLWPEKNVFLFDSPWRARILIFENITELYCHKTVLLLYLYFNYLYFMMNWHGMLDTKSTKNVFMSIGWLIWYVEWFSLWVVNLNYSHDIFYVCRYTYCTVGGCLHIIAYIIKHITQ
jgi:hypothetical protein